MILESALIKKAEQASVESGSFTFLELMQNAGEKAFDIINKKYDIKSKKVAVVCGNGNNGGDGFVISRLLYEYGADVTVFIPLGEPQTESALYYYNRLNNMKIKTDFEGDFDFIIDSLFGIGLNRPLSKDIVLLLEKLNQSNGIKIAIDIPSGIKADNGEILGSCFKADLSITFIAYKPCFFLNKGSEFCGEVIVADIGVTPEKFSYKTIKNPLLPQRPRNSHKGTFGTALLFCGSYGMAGAAMLSAKAALRSGVGIVKSVICDNIYSPFTTYIPEAVCIPVKSAENGCFNPDNIDFSKAFEKSKAMLFGCGTGTDKECEKLLELLLTKSQIPIVLDADGINLISKSIELLSKCKAPIILTPHPAEMARLCKKNVAEVEADRINTARDFAIKYKCTVVLKGAYTIVANETGEVFINILGNNGMATAGSGDVLSGITVSLLAQGLSPFEAAKSAVYLHSLAGDKAAKKRSESSMIASDIIEEL
ncbi:MAG: NAD(P)H-hydrate dehydratase [Clostridia bacterium]|nr:NAD(P)H-hydrate dehydratase [Clostridia bacterium]